MMYYHAVQSYIWNMLASARIEKYGTSPVVGDIVLACTEEKELIDCKADAEKVWHMCI